MQNNLVSKKYFAKLFYVKLILQVQYCVAIISTKRTGIKINFKLITVTDLVNSEFYNRSQNTKRNDFF